MAVRDDCRHYSSRTLASGDKRETCRLGVNEETALACPQDCLFHEPRGGMSVGWTLPVDGGPL